MAASCKTSLSCIVHVFIITVAFSTISSYASGLNPDFYQKICPSALPAIKRVVEDAVKQERRMGASLLRLHFHDCFVNGCDASLLLDSTSTMQSEKIAFPNNNSVRGFEVIDRIKAEVDKACGCAAVSCADILAVAARDSVVALGGPSWEVQLGRRDSLSAFRSKADTDIPLSFHDLPELISKFKNQGLSEKDLVALSGGHAIGFARCVTFRDRLYNETNIDPVFARSLKAICPREGGNSNLAGLDPTVSKFDIQYYSNLMEKKGVLHSDQELFNGGSTDERVKKYSKDPSSFYSDFAQSMIKMGNIRPLTGENGQIRVNCRKAN